MIKEAYEQSIKVLEKCATSHGFFAANPGYDMVFARDSMIISLGASLLREKFKQVYKNSLKTLADNQSGKGQIPNAVDKFSQRKHHVDYQSIDSSLWFLIGEYVYKKRYKDNSLFRSHQKNIDKAVIWLTYQDFSEVGLLVQPPTTDWQDAFPHRYGYTINTQALWYYVLIHFNKKKEAEKLKKLVNENKNVQLWDKEYYLAYRWKNHGKYHEKSDWFDSLGNILAILFDLADKAKAEKILSYIKNHYIDQPYPIKALDPPITPSSHYWHDYYRDCAAGVPHQYLNGGIWTYIGGFYVLALIKEKKFYEAERQLQKLAQANLSTKFTEWINGKTGREGDTQAGTKSVQGWNAATYILAFNSLKAKKALI